MSIEALFNPFSINGIQLSNRVVMAPMTRNKSKRHIPGPDVAKYYQRRALGGVGLIITEGTVIDHKAANGYPDVPSFFGSQSLIAWKKVVKAVHNAGAKIFPQLWHVGSVRQTHSCQNQGADNPQGICSEEGKIPGFAPSPIVHPYIEGGEIPHEMSCKDIEEVISAFAKAALDAKNIGFDGIEIHGAHGYLIDQFFWDYTNKRKDYYGGNSLSERTRFAVEVVKAIRRAVGPEFPIGFRFSQWKLGDYEAKLAHNEKELESFLVPLSDAGVDLFHCSTRRFWDPEFSGSDLNLAGWTKKITNKPTITVGSVGLDIDFISTLKEKKSTHLNQSKIRNLVQRFKNNEFDLVAVGRALLADPNWLEKVRQNRIHEIKTFSKECLDILY